MTDFGKRVGDMSKSTYDTDKDDVVDDSEKLDGKSKAEVQDHTPKSHVHAQSDVTSLATSLAGKAATAHEHDEEDITDLDHNALKIKGVTINDAAKADQKVLAFDSGTDRIVYITPAPSGAAIKSIQHGVVVMDGVTTNTATITAVDTAKSICILTGFSSESASERAIYTRIKLLSATEVQGDHGGSTDINRAAFMVIEFESGVKSSQRGDFSIPLNELTEDFTISEIIIGKSMLVCNGSRQGSSITQQAGTATLELIDATTIRATRGEIGAALPVFYDLLEFE